MRKAFQVCLIALTAGQLAHAQDPVKAFPGNYQLLFENSAVSVIRVHYGPHEKVGVHDHSAYPTVYVYLSDSPPVRFTHDEQPPSVLTRPAIKAGAFRVSPGRRERHSVENLGGTSSDFLRVELKQIPLGGVQAFRGEPPVSPAVTEDSVPVRQHSLAIERVVCAADPCPRIQASIVPSVVVAFTPLRLEPQPFRREGVKFSQELPSGAVRWLPAGEAAAVSREGGGPAHLLRIAIWDAAAAPGAAK